MPEQMAWMSLSTIFMGSNSLNCIYKVDMVKLIKNCYT